jgi:hypothetical protein
MIRNVRATTALCLAVAAGSVAVGCGKKGPPLAPFVRIPAPVDQITAARLGSDVYVTLTIPSKDIDAEMPAHISRVEIYGYTGRTPPLRARWAELGDLIATVPVAPPPLPDGTVPPANGAAPQGFPVTVRDTLTPDELVQGREDPIDPDKVLAPLPLPGGVVLPPKPLQRFYLAIPFNDRGRNGPPGAEAGFVITPLPEPPASLRAAYSPAGTVIAWDPSGGLIGFVVNDALPIEAAPFDDVSTLLTGVPVVAPVAALPEPVLPPGPTLYNVYRDLAPDPLALPIDANIGTSPLPVPLNGTPLAGLSLVDEVEFERERCYSVRPLRGTAPLVVGDPSPRTCVRPVDTFPPAAPAQPAAVAAEGAISLIWDPNPELDLGGYLVLRREDGSDTLQLLTAAPILEARFRDATVMPGTRYRYSIVAVDNRMPAPNQSAESIPVEETAR